MTEEELLEQQRQLFDIYSGILFNNRDFAPGKAETIRYHFDCPEYKELIAKYRIDEIAGEGTDFKRAERLLHWMSPRLKHKSDYDNHVSMNSLALLEYSLDRPENGINCRNKSLILTECCLALGITARRVYIMPYSPYDYDNHVVAEIYDQNLEKWIMMDPSADTYFIDEEGAFLSLLEIREHYANRKYAAAVEPGADTTDKKALWEGNSQYNAYIAKNLFRFMVDGENGFGQGDKRTLYFTPVGYRVQENQISGIHYQMEDLPLDAMRLRKTYLQMLKRAQEKPEPEPSDISVMEMKP